MSKKSPQKETGTVIVSAHTTTEFIAMITDLVKERGGRIRILPRGADVVRAVRELHPESVILPAKMRTCTEGLEQCARLTSMGICEKVIIVSDVHSRNHMNAVNEAGATNVLSSNPDPEELKMKLSSILPDLRR